MFRPVVRRPALLGLIREVTRLDESHINHLRGRLSAVVERCVSYLTSEMEKGRLRTCDPMVLAGLLYSTVSGTGTEPIVLETFGWEPNAAGLRQVRRSCAASCERLCNRTEVECRDGCEKEIEPVFEKGSESVCVVLARIWVRSSKEPSLSA